MGERERRRDGERGEGSDERTQRQLIFIPTQPTSRFPRHAVWTPTTSDGLTLHPARHDTSDKPTLYTVHTPELVESTSLDDLLDSIAMADSQSAVANNIVASVVLGSSRPSMRHRDGSISICYSCNYKMESVCNEGHACRRPWIVLAVLIISISKQNCYNHVKLTPTSLSIAPCRALLPNFQGILFSLNTHCDKICMGIRLFYVQSLPHCVRPYLVAAMATDLKCLGD